MQKFLSLPFYTKFACTLISIIAIGYIMHVGHTVIVPLILGLLFALLLVPFCNWLEVRLRFPRTLAAFIAVIFFVCVFVGVFTLIGSQLTLFKEDWPAFEHQILNEVTAFQKWITTTFNIGYVKQSEYLHETLSKSVSSGTAILGVALLSLSSLLILMVFTFLYTLFLLIYRRHLVRFFVILNKKEHEGIVLEIVKEIQYVVKKYLIGLALQMLLVATLSFLVLSVIGVKYSLLLAVITGVFNVLPYIGIFASILIISVITFATASPATVLLVVLGLWIVHLIDSNYIVPRIVGSKVKVNSFFALLAIILGEMMWGVSGMFLAIPILAIVKIICDRINDLKPWGFLLGEQSSSRYSIDLIRNDLNFRENESDVEPKAEEPCKGD